MWIEYKIGKLEGIFNSKNVNRIYINQIDELIINFGSEYDLRIPANGTLLLPIFKKALIGGHKLFEANGEEGYIRPFPASPSVTHMDWRNVP